MLENRDYMREPESGSPFRFRWSACTVLMVALVVIFALQQINAVYFHTKAEMWLGLTAAGLKSGYLWQLLTFQFLHGGLLHLLCNLLGLFYFGRFVEHVLGTRRFLVAYFAAGVVGGILQGLLMIAIPSHFGGILFGASAGISGMFALFAMLERDTTVQLYFVLPVRAMTLLVVLCGISLFFTLVPSRQDATAHAAHLGGLLAGIAWVKLGWHREFVTLPWEGLFSRWRRWRPLEGRQRKQELVRAAKVRTESWRRAAPDSPAELPPEEFISKEVDPILDKISAHGIHSLTDHERKVLDAARKRISKS